ncbi:helix-hairpin-helix domain-containing protein [Sphingomonas sp. BIUV-7]|uniref:Helix-hairpin-helix domain-containing protein n=1 Tax=Sphingomonas natans TaxID=3063330 RepID=A0ABT8Y7Q8_9SPHN|nr:helix-hairpin-helix domain-containing protein [Sphingomonas sp. BIUV-7]MDO6414334.1 helix-hairpin-helix domain-containing protein [Sphingomonas sp. BIUV-7]
MAWPMRGAAALMLLAAIGFARTTAAPPAAHLEPIGDPDPKDRQALVAVCGACHPVNLIDDNVRSYADWQETVRSMAERGAKGTDEQFERISNYLYLSLTALNVNEAAAEDIAAILGIPAASADAVVTRRETRKFASIADLATVAGVPSGQLEARKRRIGF